MEEVAVQIILAKFADEDAAGHALKTLRASGKGKFDIDNSAVIRKGDNGKLHIREDGDMDGREGAGAGFLIGGAIGLLAGPLGVVAGGAIGAAVTGVVAKFRDSGLRNERLEEFGAALEPGSSTLIVVVEYMWTGDVKEMLEAAGGQVDTSLLTDDMMARIKEAATTEIPGVIRKPPRAEDVDNRFRSGA